MVVRRKLVPADAFPAAPRGARKERAMAAPSSPSTPRRAAASKPARKFSLEQANRSLPYVKRIVADIVRTHALASSYRESLEQLAGAKEAAGLQQQLDRSIDRLQDLVDELSDVGVEL